MASLTLTYLLWIIGGILGLHHLYLGRINHSFVWFATLGGVFGIGWFRDMWRIPSYVEWRNKDKEFQTQHLTFIALKKRPSGGLIRSFGMLVMGCLTSVVLCGLLPYNSDDPDISSASLKFYRVCSFIFIMAGSSIGVSVVANIGEMQCSFVYPFVGSLLATPWVLAHDSNVIVPSVLASLVTWWFGLQWRPLDSKSQSRRGIVNVLIFLTCTSLWSAAFCYGIYHHAEITVNNGEKIPVRVALRNFFASPAWSRVKDSFYRIYLVLRDEGWREAFSDAVVLFDFSGEGNALQVLGLDNDADQATITKTCRKMSSQFHPDRHKTPDAKAEAQAKFLRVREACNVLTRKPYQRNRSTQ